MDDGDRPEHPVLTGLAALVGVAVAVGLVLGLVALVGTQVLGLGGGSSSQATTAQARCTCPGRRRPQEPSGPLITLDRQASPSPAAQPGRKADKPKTRRRSRSPPARPRSAPMQQIDLTGVYPGGEGAVLQVQRFTGGWTDFPVTASVSNETFSTYVQTSQPGVNRFRVVDTDTGTTSNEVRVRVG